MLHRRGTILAAAAKLEVVQFLPETAAACIEAIDEERNLSQVVALVETDPALTANLLKCANSIYYTPFLGRAVGTVREALIRLGLVECKKLVIALGVVRTLRGRGYANWPPGFWEHSMAVAGMTIRLMQRRRGAGLDRHDLSRIYTASLLHDLGILVLVQVSPIGYREVVQQLGVRARVAVCDVEEEVLGVRHTEVGALVAMHWKLPPLFEHLLGDHHREAVDFNDLPLSALYLADQLSLRIAEDQAGPMLAPVPGHRTLPSNERALLAEELGRSNQIVSLVA